MRYLILLPFLALLVSCADQGLTEPSVDPQFARVAASTPPTATPYYFQGHRDWTCDEADGCLFGTSHTTPSGLAHGKGLKIRLTLDGDLVGELWVMVGYNLNMNTGHGVANGTALLNLTEPGVGGFECKAHADWWDWVEHVKYSGCKGFGDFEGQQMTVWATDEAAPTSGEYEGLAEIW